MHRLNCKNSYLFSGKSSHSFRHISSFLVDPAPDVFSDLPPFQPEFLFEKKPFLLRFVILSCTKCYTWLLYCCSFIFWKEKVADKKVNEF